MMLSINFAILTFFSFLSNFLKHFRVGRCENLLFIFLEGNRNYSVGTKKTGSVDLAETQVFFRPEASKSDSVNLLT